MLQALDERAHAQEFRNDFLDNVTHELRTPLSTLNASLELLLEPGRLSRRKRCALFCSPRISAWSPSSN